MNNPGEHSLDWTVKEERVCICGWPTDTLCIDHEGLKSDDLASISSSRHNEDTKRNNAHTLILFVPGNPGVIHWYIDSLAQIVKRLGKGFAVRGISYAGHGVGEDVVGTKDDHNQSFHSENLDNESVYVEDGNRPNKDIRIPWTMEGQVDHKIKWIDEILEDWRKQSSSNSHPNLIFITHSIGAHLAQCVLLRRPDILAKMVHTIHLTPFFRFDPYPMTKLFLSSSAHSYKYIIPMATNLVGALSSTLPRSWINLYLDKVAGVDCIKGREIALDVFMHPNMVKNHLVLGTQEVRELPEHPNDVALRLIGAISPTSILFTANDIWAPEFHLRDLKKMQSRSEVPDNIHTEFMEKLSHDFVVHPEMIEPVVGFCVGRIKDKKGVLGTNIRSRL